MHVYVCMYVKRTCTRKETRGEYQLSLSILSPRHRVSRGTCLGGRPANPSDPPVSTPQNAKVMGAEAYAASALTHQAIPPDPRYFLSAAPEV